MKAKFLPKLLLMMLFSLSLYSCTADDMPAKQNEATATDPGLGTEGGPVIPPGPRP